jgi:hypothetical protein
MTPEESDDQIVNSPSRDENEKGNGGKGGKSSKDTKKHKRPKSKDDSMNDRIRQ